MFLTVVAAAVGSYILQSFFTKSVTSPVKECLKSIDVPIQMQILRIGMLKENAA